MTKLPPNQWPVAMNNDDNRGITVLDVRNQQIAELKEQAQKREGELAAKDKTVRCAKRLIIFYTSSYFLQVNELFEKLNAKSSSMYMYCMASFFLSLFLAVSIALIAQRHMELIKVLDDKSNCTQWVLDLSTKVGKCGEEQLTELKVCRTEHNNLTEMVGRCVIYKQNLEDNSTTVAVMRQRELLEEWLSDSKDQVAKEFERSKSCDNRLVGCEKRLQKIEDEVISLLNISQKLLSENEICFLKLIASQESLTLCEKQEQASGQTPKV